MSKKTTKALVFPDVKNSRGDGSTYSMNIQSYDHDHCKFCGASDVPMLAIGTDNSIENDEWVEICFECINSYHPDNHPINSPHNQENGIFFNNLTESDDIG